ncbi:DNA-3-methyladenine glycosylase [Micromonospora yangpuensis]|uniref:Putative 3-methyladenine DNA glycosylase n=1 Tax=Micromonospora yangpuensis TaxID=683228 RepID=A0A1C6UJ96_9ACTN|nr:DNA-3-methyladenine glycosylase [Micromonospora yangpuensis]GGM02752.1 putative 3-methyladenine DNA glycosylase [Micromonospora yangpuensis]SCL54041.1 DNA-3-methyladenine glycosylase [Micromonospora yangpuensis]
MSPDLLAILAQPAPLVAPHLIGWTLTHHTPHGSVAIELTEVEAYAGESDPASHAWRGPTARNSVMFGPAGRLYVYLSHGLHHCANVVTGPEGEASAVLLRAGRVVAGVDVARRRRGEQVARHSLARGPGNLGQALALTRQHSGAHLFDGGPLVLSPPSRTPAAVSSGPRVGVSRAHDWPWRYWLPGDPTVSAYRRGKTADTQPVPHLPL